MQKWEVKRYLEKQQICSWSTKWSKAKANRILPRECIGHSKHPFLTTQRWLYTWISPDGQYWNQIDHILCSWRCRSSTQSAKTRPGAECGSNHQLLIAKFRLKLERAEKTTRPRRYNLNQISCNYTVEVMNRFKRLVLVNTVPEELRTEVCNVV